MTNDNDILPDLKTVSSIAVGSLVSLIFAKLMGLDGPQGEKGPQGARGPQGEKGPPGIFGGKSNPKLHDIYDGSDTPRSAASSEWFTQKKKRKSRRRKSKSRSRRKKKS